MNSASKIYDEVIDDVIKGVRDDFVEEIGDIQILDELKLLWRSKLFGNQEKSQTRTPPNQQGNSFRF